CRWAACRSCAGSWAARARRCSTCLKSAPCSPAMAFEPGGCYQPAPMPRKAKSRASDSMSEAAPPCFQEIILRLQAYWAEQGCAILQPYDMEVGAGTLHPATTLRALGPKHWRAAYVQPSRRPKDGRYGENPNRLQHYYQYQVILKPNP